MHRLCYTLVFLLVLAIPLSLGIDVSTCQAITSPGTYDLITDLSGAGITITGISLVDEACIAIQADNVILDCHGHTITNDGTLDAVAIARNISSGGAIIRNCRVSGYENGMSIGYLSGGAVINNTAHSNSDTGIDLLQSCSNNVVSNNTIYNNTDYAINLGGGSDNNVFSNNTICNTTGSYSAFSIGTNCDGNTFEWNNVYGNSGGDAFDLSYSNNNTFANNLVWDNYMYGFIIDHSHDNLFVNNTVYDNYYGFYVHPYSYWNDLLNNTAYGNSQYGFYIYQYCDKSNLTNNTAYDNRWGFTFGTGSDNCTLTGNTAYENEIGFSLDSHDNTLTNNTAFNNSQHGFYLSSVYGNTFINNIAFNNGWNEFRVRNSNYTMQSFLVLNPSGSLVNYTNLSITDIMDTSTEEYTIMWDESPGSSPAGMETFGNKFVTITDEGGDPAVDSMVWHWTDSEASGHTESDFKLWKYNSSGWTLLNDTPDTSSNVLSAYDVTFATTYNPSLYGLFEESPWAVSSCRAITSPGEYNLTTNLSGAGITIGGIAGISEACIAIQSDNVILDCQGHTITDDLTPDAAGIASNGSSVLNYTNITIRNCAGVSGYNQGIALYYSNASTINNNTVYNSSGNGIYLYESPNNSITDNTAYNSSSYGIFAGSNNTLTNNTCHSQGYSGFGVGSGNELHGNFAYNNTGHGFVFGGHNNTLTGNIAYNNSQYGFTFQGTPYGNTIFNNTACNNTYYGFTVSLGFNNIVANNTAYGNNDGFSLDFGGNNTLANNTAYGNSQYGIYLAFAANGTITNNTAYSNSGADFRFYTVSNTTLADNAAYNSPYGFLVHKSNYTMQNMLFLNPYGTYENYTNLSVSDIMGDGEAYSINWSASPGSAPAGKGSFESKYLNITNQSSTAVSIDSITWHWDESELPGYAESAFELWKYNSSGWALLNGTPDTSSNTLSQYNMNPASIYGIFGTDISACQAVTSPGTYYLTSNLSGAGSGIPIGGSYPASCIAIGAHNVTIDCNGFSIVNDGTSDAVGIGTNGSSSYNYYNITIQNCIISGYDADIFYNYAQQGRVINSTALNASDYSIRYWRSPFPTVANSTMDGVLSGGNYNLYLYVSPNATITNNFLNGSWSSGMYIRLSGNTTIANNNVSNSSQAADGAGIYLSASHHTVIENNSVQESDAGGIAIYDSEYVNITNNTALHSAFGGMGAGDCNYTRFVGNAAYNQTTGLSLSNCLHSAFINNTVHNSTRTNPPAFLADSSPGTNFTGNTAYNAYFGFRVLSSENATLERNTAYTITSSGFIVQTGSNNALVRDNVAYDIDYSAFTLLSIRYGTFINNTARDSSSFANGFRVDLVNYTLLENNTVYNVDYPGIYIRDSHDCNFTGNSVYENGDDGFEMMRVYNLLFVNNSAYWNDARGFIINSYANNTRFYNNTIYSNNLGIYVQYANDTYILDNLIYNQSNAGIQVNSNAKNLTVRGNVFYNNSYGIDTEAAGTTLIFNNSMYENSWRGISLSNAASPVVANNTVFDNTNGGIYASNLQDAVFENNTIYGNTQYGIEVRYSNATNVTNNLAYGNAFQGFSIYMSNHTNVFNNTAHSNNRGGFRAMVESQNTTLADNYAYNNTGYGFYLYGSVDVALTNNYAYNNSGSGFLIAYLSHSANLTGNTAYNNTAGLDFSDSLSGVFANMLLYANTYSFNASEGSGASYTATNLTFRDQHGSAGNYTSLDISDTLSSDGYLLNWSASPGVSPPGRDAFENKCLNISTVTGTPSIDSLSWNWLDSEAAAYNESALELWKYNISSGWSLLNNSPDTSSNLLSLYNLNPASIYGLFAFNDTEAPQITLGIPNEGYPTNSSVLTFSFNATDNVYEYFNCSLYIDASLNQSNASTTNGTLTYFNASDIAEGSHNWSITCIDNSSNSNSSEVRNFSVDSIAPILSISSPANSSYSTNNLSVNYTTDGNTCSLFMDGTLNQSLSSCENTTLANVSDSQHYATIYVNDTYNNSNSSTIYFIVDAFAPSVSITSPANTTYSSTSLPLSYTATDSLGVDTCWFYLNGTFNSTLANCTGTTITGLSPGQYNVSVYANDSQNNTASDTVFFTIAEESGGGDDGGSDAPDYECVTSSDCSECEICSGHECVLPEDSCNSASDCSGEYPFYECEECSCIGYECEADGDCGPGYTCEEGECIPPECFTDEDCGEGYLCEDYECFLPECIEDEDCPGEGETCGDYECIPPECLTLEDCPDGYTCGNYTCIPPECFTDEDCEEGYVCEDYNCTLWVCQTSADCGEGFVCEDGVCLQETTPTGTGGTPSGSPSGGAGGIGSHSIAQPEGPTLSEQFGIAQFALPLVEGDILEELLPEMSVEERGVVGTGALFFAILLVAVIYVLTHRVAGKRRRKGAG